MSSPPGASSKRACPRAASSPGRCAGADALHRAALLLTLGGARAVVALLQTLPTWDGDAMEAADAR